MKVLKSIKHCIAAAVTSLLVACGGSTSPEENLHMHAARLPNEISTGVEFTAGLQDNSIECLGQALFIERFI